MTPKHLPRYLSLSGGVGGAKLALGLSCVLAPEDLLIVANTGDDFEHLGLHVSPDLDTLMYTLAGRADVTQGWGVEGETWNAMTTLRELGGPDWFRLGDRDLAVHLWRSARLRAGAGLATVTAGLAAALGVRHRITPVSDDPIRTMVLTADGVLPFQDYFVRLQCAPPVTGFRFDGAATAHLHESVRAALAYPGLRGIFLCPSNPFVSIGPMLAMPELRSLIARAHAPVIAVSPIVGGQALKGPTAKMMRELGMPSSACAIAEHYRDLIDLLVLDDLDRDAQQEVRGLGLRTSLFPIVMRHESDKVALAEHVLALAAGMGP